MVVTSSSNSTTSYSDDNFSGSVGIVQIYPSDESPKSNPVVPVGKSISLIMDMLGEEYEFLQAKLVHCNSDWKKSSLSPLDYIEVANEFQLDDFQYSINTLRPYTQYRWRSPQINYPGNYALIVYRESNENDMVLMRRFVVYSNAVSVTTQVNYSSLASRRQTHHQITFEVEYGNLNVFNPQADLKVAILQNHNWKTAIMDLKPSIARIDQKFLGYTNYNGENEFWAGNEFRFADLRATQFRGLNVENVVPRKEHFEISLVPDKPRGSNVYSNLFQDNNGAFEISNLDPDESQLQADYVLTRFTLEARKTDSPVFIEGKFNNWNAQSEHQLVYNDESGKYEGRVLLKQGLYDFQYNIHEDYSKKNPIEGSYVEAANDYEVFLYFRNPRTNVDEVVGYDFVSSGN